MKCQYRRDRSEFWITIYYNDDKSYNISTKSKYVELINCFFPMLENDSPTKWKHSETYSSLWLPEGCYDQKNMGRFMNWCDEAISNVLWLHLNKNIAQYFNDELDFCIASDFNYIYDNGRTEMGEAEYQLKYNIDKINEAECNRYGSKIMNKMLDNCKFIPITNNSEWYISPMPATKLGREKIAWLLAEEMAKQLGVLFINSFLTYDKPQMKQLSIEDKLKIWSEIYYNDYVKIDKNIQNKNVIIIDDLYQSGTTMWQYASFLKRMGAKRVFGVVCVKSLKDSDNI